ncbi:hypothetical protein RQP46_004071 [Phenoliferia psychrophenolica]
MLFNLSSVTLFALSVLSATSVLADAHHHTRASMKRSQDLANRKIAERSYLPRAVPHTKMALRRRAGPHRLNANSGGRGGPQGNNGGGGGGRGNGGSSQNQSASSASTSSSGDGAGIDVSVSVGTATTSKAAAASSTASSSSSSSSSSTTYSGKATYFYQEGGTGACGSVNVDSAKIVALQTAMYASDLCGKTVVITNTANGKSVTATVADECPGCLTSESLDLSTGAFDSIGDEDTGVLSITWYFEN